MNTDRSNQHELSLLAEFGGFLRRHKAWWLLPLLVVAILFAVLIFVSGTATTPFIYTTH